MITEKEFRKVPVEKATALPDKNGFFQLYKDRYWVVTEDNCILFYKGLNGNGSSPQCNPNKTITDHTVEMCKDMFPGARAELIERVWTSHDCQDYV